jgi:hypothetical protein
VKEPQTGKAKKAVETKEVVETKEAVEARKAVETKEAVETKVEDVVEPVKPKKYRISWRYITKKRRPR